MSGYVSPPEKILLAFRSGGRCARCREIITVEATAYDPARTLGVAAHIKGENPTAARYDAAQPDHERNVYANLVYLCGDCHTTVDKQSNSYPVRTLLEMKVDHEAWVNTKLGESAVAVGFHELGIIAKALLKKPHDPTLDFAVLSPEAKMKTNSLGPAVLDQLKIGYGKVPEVTKFVNQGAAMDADFPERLKAGFIEEYTALSAKGIQGDALFFALREFASLGSTDFMEQAAGLSILTYLFQKCEVFEH